MPLYKANPAEDRVRSEVFVIINFSRKMVVIGETFYGGKIKEAIFMIMNFLLPFQGVFPMHCSANVGEEGGCGDLLWAFWNRQDITFCRFESFLIGDDEHGWSERRILG